MTLSASFMIARSDDIASCSIDGKRTNFWNSSVVNKLKTINTTKVCASHITFVQQSTAEHHKSNLCESDEIVKYPLRKNFGKTVSIHHHFIIA